MTLQSAGLIGTSCPARYNASVLCHYVIVRADLPRGIQSAQIVHAAGESTLAPLPDGTFAVVLVTKDEPELLAIERRLALLGLPFVPIREPDAPYCGQLMALGIVPQAKGAVRKHLSDLKLLR